MLLYWKLNGGTLCQRIPDFLNTRYKKQLDKFVNVKPILECCTRRTCGHLRQSLGVINCWETVPRKYRKLIVCILYWASALVRSWETARLVCWTSGMTKRGCHTVKNLEIRLSLLSVIKPRAVCLLLCHPAFQVTASHHCCSLKNCTSQHGLQKKPLHTLSPTAGSYCPITRTSESGGKNSTRTSSRTTSSGSSVSSKGS